MNDDTEDYWLWFMAQSEKMERFRRGAYPWARTEDCTCSGSWMSILPPPPCPYHGQFDNMQITC